MNYQIDKSRQNWQIHMNHLSKHGFKLLMCDRYAWVVFFTSKGNSKGLILQNSVSSDMKLANSVMDNSKRTSSSGQKTIMTVSDWWWR